MNEVEGINAANDRVARPPERHPRQRNRTNPQPVARGREQLGQVRQPQQQKYPLEFDTDTEVSRGLKTAGVGSVIGAAGYGALGALSGSIELGALSAASGLVSGGLYGLGLYTGGILHRLAWHDSEKPSKKVGALGTVARGLVSPVTVPVGFLTKPFRK